MGGLSKSGKVQRGERECSVGVGKSSKVGKRDRWNQSRGQELTKETKMQNRAVREAKDAKRSS